MHTQEVDETTAVFVPRGVGNSYQALADHTVYSYLVNDHWSPGTVYPALHLADETAAIPWPIPLESAEAEVSEKDLGNPRLADVEPMQPRRTLITGCRGQLGRALARVAAHELEHYSAQQLHHDDKGLMRAAFDGLHLAADDSNRFRPPPKD